MTERSLSPAELDELVPELLLVESWAAAVREQIHECLLHGAVMEHASLVPKRTQRQWRVSTDDLLVDLPCILDSLGTPSNLDTVAPRKVLSVAQAEKLIGKKNFAEMADGLWELPEAVGYNLKLN